MENNRRCDIRNIDVHQASYAKHMRSKKHLDNLGQYDIIIPEWLFKEELLRIPLKKSFKKVFNPKALKLIAIQIIKLNDKKLDKELAKRSINP